MNKQLFHFLTFCCVFFSIFISAFADLCLPAYKAGTNYTIGSGMVYNGYQYTCTFTAGRTAQDTNWLCSNRYPGQEVWDNFWVKGRATTECQVVPGTLEVRKKIVVSAIPGFDGGNKTDPGTWIDGNFGIVTRGLHSGGEFSQLNNPASVKLAFSDVGVYSVGDLTAGLFSNLNYTNRNTVALATQGYSIEAAGKIRVGTGRMYLSDDWNPTEITRLDIDLLAGDRSWYLNSNENGDFELVPTSGKWSDRTWIRGSNGDMSVGGNIYFEGGNVKNLLDRIAKLEAKVKALEAAIK